jgi:hypothetical protein
VRKSPARALSLIVFLATPVATSGCKPATVAEAEARGDVAWLQQNDTPDAVAALGRLGDKNPAAINALALRSSYDIEAFHVAWDAVLRGAPWAASFEHDALTDPARADRAATAMAAHDSHLVAFLPDLENALVRLSASPQNVNIASTLASVGPAAHDAIEHRLSDASTRGSMCMGIASNRADGDARKALIEVPESARDAPSCVDAVVLAAADDAGPLAWLAEKAEPGLLGAASKSAGMPCARLHEAWVKAFAARPEGTYAAMTVPLGYAITRCPAQMDGILADALAHRPAAHEIVLRAIDPFASYGDGLHATCAALPAVAVGHDTAVLRERASDAVSHACKAPG